MGVQARTGSRMSSRDFYAFDSLEMAADSTTNLLPENVLIVAIDRGLVVYKLEKATLNIFGRLEGLRGKVLGAKILPYASRIDLLGKQRPLIAVIVHGPVFSSQDIGRVPPGVTTSEGSEFDPSESMSDALQNADVVSAQKLSRYQTTVEIYSLKDVSHIATILHCPPVPVDVRSRGKDIVSSAHVEQLHLHASGKFLVIGSGTSGEIWIFEACQRSTPSSPEPFRCLGKTWTSIPNRTSRTWSTSSTSYESESTHDGWPSRGIELEVPILSLSHRWLAIVPPVPSSRSTLHCQVNLSGANVQVSGLTSHTAPSQPQTNCELDIPLGESAINRMARDAAQEVIKGAKWITDQGTQVWKNYWNKQTGTSNSPHFGSYPPMQQQQHQQSFPPTHANDDRIRASTQSDLVSVLDLERLSSSLETKASVYVHPIVTFALPAGCSYLSFSPSGLSLLSASAKGDVQYVWDLMRMIHGNVNIDSTDGSAAVEITPTVRQVARFVRLTTANIVDVVWTAPRGEEVAMVTDRGTVHIFDLPANAYRWPPQRRIGRPATSLSADPSMTSLTKPIDLQAPKGSTFSTALNMVSSKTPSLFSTPRGRPQSIGSAISGLGSFNIAAGAGAKGGKAFAVGIGKSVEAATDTMNTIRHLGENRVQIPGSPSAPLNVNSGCIRWLHGKVEVKKSRDGKDKADLAVVGAGILRIHHVSQSKIAKTARRRPSAIGEKPAELSLRAFPAPSTLSDQGPVLSGYWPPSPFQIYKNDRGIGNPTSYAELSTNAPYQPFHTDHRINLYSYQGVHDAEDGTHHFRNSTTPWVFGEEIQTALICSGAAISEDVTEPGHTGVEDLITFQGKGEVVVSTRRRKAEEENGEEDFAIVEFVEERV